MDPILGRRAFCRCVIDSILFVLRSFSSSYCFFCDEILSCCLDDHEWSSTICRKRNLSRSPNHSANALCATQISSSGYWLEPLQLGIIVAVVILLQWLSKFGSLHWRRRYNSRSYCAHRLMDLAQSKSVPSFLIRLANTSENTTVEAGGKSDFAKASRCVSQIL